MLHTAQLLCLMLIELYFLFYRSHWFRYTLYILFTIKYILISNVNKSVPDSFVSCFKLRSHPTFTIYIFIYIYSFAKLLGKNLDNYIFHFCGTVKPVQLMFDIDICLFIPLNLNTLSAVMKFGSLGPWKKFT